MTDDNRGGWVQRLRAGLSRTREQLAGQLDILRGSPVGDEYYAALEEALILADAGAQSAADVVAALRVERGLRTAEDVRGALTRILQARLGPVEPLRTAPAPAVILMLGTNGSGKTTTIGKLAYRLAQDGQTVLVAAADTFRAAAIDQLAVWAQRTGADLVRQQPGGDPGAVVYDALQAAVARQKDVLLIDTAGRLHTKVNLMDELRKLNRIIARAAPPAVERLMVLDASTGQNGISQARLFHEAVDLTGIVLTKVDGTAKGGIVLAIAGELGLPVKLVGVGEGLDDLIPFDPHAFVEGLLA